MRKIIVLLIVLCLLLVVPGCNYNRGSSTSVPDVPQTVTTTTTENLPPVTSIQQSSNPTMANNNNIIFTHTYSPGHSYRIQLPGTWQGKYSVKETKDVVTFSFYKPVYYNVRPGSDQKVPGYDPIFGIDTETESQWEKDKQGPFGYGKELASRDGLVFLLYPSISNDYEGQDAAEYEQLADDAWLRIGKTFEFVDGN